MLIQIFLGTVLMLVTIVIAGASYWVMEAMFERHHEWLLREPHQPKLIAVVSVAAIWSMGIITVDVWIWAVVLRELTIFPTLEEAVYFALVSFTTLGFGDIVLSTDWRIFGGMAAANGLMMIGFLTAMMIEVVRHLRQGQAEWRRRRM